MPIAFPLSLRGCEQIPDNRGDRRVRRASFPAGSLRLPFFAIEAFSGDAPARSPGMRWREAVYRREKDREALQWPNLVWKPAASI